MLKDTLKYNVGSKPENLDTIKYSARDMRIIEKRAMKLSRRSNLLNIIEIDGCIETSLTHDEWLNQFVLWVESCNERFGGGTKGCAPAKGCVSSNQKSVFTEKFQKVIKETIEGYKYNPDEDPVLIEHKRRIREILG